jgi:hypothetical protein
MCLGCDEAVNRANADKLERYRREAEVAHRLPRAPLRRRLAADRLEARPQTARPQTAMPQVTGLPRLRA